MTVVNATGSSTQSTTAKREARKQMDAEKAFKVDLNGLLRDTDSEKVNKAVISYCMTEYKDASDKDFAKKELLASLKNAHNGADFLAHMGIAPNDKFKGVKVPEGVTHAQVVEMWTSKRAPIASKAKAGTLELTQGQQEKRDTLTSAITNVEAAAVEYRSSFDVATLKNMSSAQLRELAKEAQLKGRSGLKKLELVELIHTGNVPAPEKESVRWYKAEGKRLKAEGKIIGAVSSLNGDNLRKVVAAAQSGKVVSLKKVTTVEITFS